MGKMKGHPSPARSQVRKAVCLTILVVSALAAGLAYALNQRLAVAVSLQPINVHSLPGLQSYLQRYAATAELQDPGRAEMLRNVSMVLETVMRNSSRLPSKEEEVSSLQDKLTKVHQDLANANAQIKKLEDQAKQQESDKVKLLGEKDAQLAEKDKQLGEKEKQLGDKDTQLVEKEKVIQQLNEANSQAQKQLGEVNSQVQTLQASKDEAEQLRKQKEQLEQEKRVLQQNQPAAGAAVEAKFRALAVAGEQCSPVKDYEFWADPTLVWGYDHRAADAAECCAACHSHR